MKLFRKRAVFLRNITIAFIILFAFFLRAQESITGNYLFLIDQGRDMMAVKQIVFDHKLTLIGPYTSLQGVFQGPIWFYLLSVPTFILNGNPIGGVWLMLVISILVIIIASYWVGKRFGIFAGIITALLFTFSPQAIAAATFTWNPHPMWLIILLFIIFFYKAIHENSKYYLLALPLISLMFHFETALAFFIFISAFLYVIFFKRKDIISKELLIGGVFFLLFFTPQVLFDFRHEFLMTKSVLKIFSGSNQGLLVTGEERNYPNLVASHMETIFLNFRSSFPFEGIFITVPYLSIILIIAAVANSFREKLKQKKRSDFIKFLFLFTVFMLIPMVFLYPFPLRPWFLTGMEVFYLLAVAVSLGMFWENRVVKALFVLFTVLVFYFAVLRIYSLYINNQDFGGVSKNKGKIEAIDYIYKDSNGEKFGILIFTPPVYTYAYDYLIWWYGKTRYGYIPPYEKKKETYLLMEPDPGRPDSYNGWLETVIKNGEIEKTSTMSSGLIIQKRAYEE